MCIIYHKNTLLFNHTRNTLNYHEQRLTQMFPVHLIVYKELADTSLLFLHMSCAMLLHLTTLTQLLQGAQRTVINEMRLFLLCCILTKHPVPNKRRTHLPPSGNVSCQSLTTRNTGRFHISGTIVYIRKEYVPETKRTQQTVT